MGIINTILRRREPYTGYRTVDGGHPAPYPDMTDEQLYNYEIAFNVPNKTFDRPPPRAQVEQPPPEPVWPDATRTERNAERSASRARMEMPQPEAGRKAPQPEAPPMETLADDDDDKPTMRRPTFMDLDIQPPLDFSKPVRTVTTKQPVEIITTRARHPVYKVHGYIGNDDVLTVFTLDGRLSENGPRFLENAPAAEQLFLNVYRNLNPRVRDRYRLTQHRSQEEADAAAEPGRIGCVRVQFDL